MKWIGIIAVFLMGLGSFAQDINYVKEKATYLCSPDMKGRGYVDNGLQKAAKYISKEFKRLGLETVGEEYCQEFTHTVNTFPGDVEFKIDGKKMEPGKDFLVDPNSSGVKGSYYARVFDETMLRDLRSPEDFSESCEECALVLKLSPLASKEEKELARQIKGLYSTYMPVVWASKSKLTWGVGTYQLDFPVIECTRPELLFDGAMIYLDIDAVLENAFVSENIIAQVRGTEYPDSMVFFTAHYDHLGMMGDEACFYGANDNASGTAFIMSLAKYYAENPAKFTCVFVAFAGEEAGLVGSKFFVESKAVDLSKIRFLFNLDLMSSGIDGITVVNAMENDDEFQAMMNLNESKGYLPLIKPRKQTANSDHYYFSKAGVPAVFIYALGGSKAYHDIYDVSENLTFEEYSDIFKLLTDLVSKF